MAERSPGSLASHHQRERHPRIYSPAIAKKTSIERSPRGVDHLAQCGELGAKLIELRFPVDRASRRCQRLGMVGDSLGLTSHKSSCNCTGCGMLRAGVCINCAEKTVTLILESGPGEFAVEPCSGACREAIELYFSTPPERWRAPRAP